MKEQWEHECEALRAEVTALQQQLQTLAAQQASAKTLSRWRVSKSMRLGLLPLVVLLAAGGVLYGQGAMDALFIDKDGKVGIGTTTPSAKFEVSLSNPNGWSGNLRGLRLLSPDPNYGLDVYAHVIESGNVGYHLTPMSPSSSTMADLGLEITTRGNVGIGTKAETTLDVAGGIKATSIDVRERAQAQSLAFINEKGEEYQHNWIGMANNIDGDTKWLHIGGITDGADNNKQRRIALYANTTYIDGNVGIWTKQPKARLDVNGDIKATNITFTSQKVCSPVVGNQWRDTIIVPATWTKETCNNYRAKVGASAYNLACIFENSYSFGS